MDLDLLEEGSNLFSYTPADEAYMSRSILRSVLRMLLPEIGSTYI